MIIIFLRITLKCLMKVYFSEINDPSIKKKFEIIISKNGYEIKSIVKKINAILMILSCRIKLIFFIFFCLL